MTRKAQPVNIASFASLLILILATPALAKPAKCFTTDDGEYSCEFKSIDRAGSFTISAPGKPTFTLEVDSPGVAFGFGDFGTGRNVALPGRFGRSSGDPACWVNSDTDTKICAWQGVPARPAEPPASGRVAKRPCGKNRGTRRAPAC